jgi:hypothetical protein
MSHLNRRSNKKVSPNCPHCKNLGLESGHWLRASTDPDSEVVCPVLKNTECKYCHKMGHNVSKCSRLLAKKNAEKNIIVPESITTSSSSNNIVVHIAKPSYASALLMQMLHKSNKVSVECSIQESVCKPVKPVKSVFKARIFPDGKKPSWADDDAWASSDEDE